MAGTAYLDVAAYRAILALSPKGRPLAGLIAASPSVASDAVYGWVASHRPFLSSVLAPGPPAAIDRKWFIAGGDCGSADLRTCASVRESLQITAWWAPLPDAVGERLPR